jgi:F0F1-type ATP synthase membrane subunit a
VGLGKSIKKSNVLFIEEEHAMLSQMVCEPTSSMVLTLGLSIFVFAIFFIHGCFELWNVEFEEFALVQLPTNLVLKFCHGNSKNWHINVTRCASN